VKLNFLCRFGTNNKILKGKLTLFLLLIFSNVWLKAQSIDSVIDCSNISHSLFFIQKAYGFVPKTTNATESISSQNFLPLTEIEKKYGYGSTLAVKPLYLKFTLINSSAQKDTIVFSPGYIVKKISFYTIDSSTKKVIPLTHVKSMNSYHFFELNPNEKITIYTEVIFNKRLGTFWIAPVLINQKHFSAFTRSYTNLREDVKTFGYILSGILLMVILFSLTNYVVNKRKEFLYYGMYSLSVLVLVFFHAYLYRHSGLFSSLFNEYIDFALILIGCIFYIAFTRNFLNTVTDYPRIDKVFLWQKRFLIIMLLLYTFLHFFTNLITLESLLENILKIIILLFGVFYIIVALKENKKLINYLAYGNALSITFSIISLALVLGGVRQTGVLNSAMVYYEAGLVMALVAFLAGLSYKNKTEIEQNVKQQSALKLEAEKQKYETEIAIFKAQQEERNRISADMHDDLGAGMTSIRLYSELAKNKLKGQEISEIEKISSSANELLGKMNAIIWSMSSSNDSLENMIAYIRSYTLEYFEDTDIKCNINLPAKIPYAIVNGYIRRNVFLVVKEALNNILKHSGATVVSITLNVYEKTLQLLIHDNGKGIDFENLRQFSNGLKNMKKRMDDVEIDFKIETNNGTLITLTREIRES
jgi:signal transduction histidine kinase